LRVSLVAGGVAREVRGWEKTSDHAPAWIELKTPEKIQVKQRFRAAVSGTVAWKFVRCIPKPERARNRIRILFEIARLFCGSRY
jgi:hypothetical protein